MLGVQELIVICLIFWPVIALIALIDILKNEFKGNDKLIWVLVVLFFPGLGSLLYLIMGRKRKL